MVAEFSSTSEDWPDNPSSLKRSRSRSGEFPKDSLVKQNDSSLFTTASYDVLMQHIKMPPTGDVDVSGVFSLECLNDWLSTRKQEIVHPVSSFQRVLYAHIRGADKRRPFPPKVEAKLLQVLRNESANPWEVFFPTANAKLGKRGFKRKGFHEANTRCVGSTEVVSKKSSNQLNYFWNSLEQPFFDGHTPWQRLGEVSKRYLNPYIRWRSMQTANKRGLDVYTSGLLHNLQQEPDHQDIRFKYSFLMPTPEESSFFNDRPVASLIGDYNQVVAESAEAVEIFKGSCVGMHFFELVQNLTVFMYASIFFVPKLMHNHMVFWRDVLLRNDGTCFVALIKMSYIDENSGILPGSRTLFQVQDITKEFSFLIHNSLLIL